MESIDLDMDDLFDDHARDDQDIQQLDDAQLHGDGAEQEDEDGELGSQVMQQLRDMSKGAAKKVVRKPMPKLDADRLTGDRGLPVLNSIFENVKFKGKGYEKDDLNLLMRKMEHWAHRLFPKMPFDEVIERAERLGGKKQVQTVVKKLRLDMPLLDDDFVDEGANQPDNNNDNDVPVDPFDEILPPRDGDPETNVQQNKEPVVNNISDDEDDEFENFISNMDTSTLNENDVEKNRHAVNENEANSLTGDVQMDSDEDRLDGEVSIGRNNRKNRIHESSDSEDEDRTTNKPDSREVNKEMPHSHESEDTGSAKNTSLHLHVSLSSDEDDNATDNRDLDRSNKAEPMACADTEIAKSESEQTEFYNSESQGNLNLHLTESESLDLHLTETAENENEKLESTEIEISKSHSAKTEIRNSESQGNPNLHMTESESSDLHLTETAENENLESIDDEVSKNDSAKTEIRNSESQVLNLHLKESENLDLHLTENENEILESTGTEVSKSESAKTEIHNSESEDLNLRLTESENNQIPTEDEIFQLTQGLTAEDFDDDF